MRAGCLAQKNTWGHADFGKGYPALRRKGFFFLGLGLEGDQKHLGSLDLGRKAGKSPLGGEWVGILTPRALRPLLGDHKDLSQEPSSAGSWGSNPYGPETACSARHSPGKPGRDGSYGRRQRDPQLNHTPTASLLQKILSNVAGIMAWILTISVHREIPRSHLGSLTQLPWILWAPLPGIKWWPCVSCTSSLCVF